MKQRTRKRTADQAALMDEMNVKIGEHLRMARASLDMSQSALGEVIGVTFQQVQKYETGMNRLPIANLVMFCRETGISVATFFDGLGVPFDDGLEINAKTTGRTARRLLVAFNKIKDPATQSALLRILESVVDAEDRAAVQEVSRNVR